MTGRDIASNLWISPLPLYYVFGFLFLRSSDDPYDRILFLKFEYFAVCNFCCNFCVFVKFLCLFSVMTTLDFNSVERDKYKQKGSDPAKKRIESVTY